jgi:zinc transporter ZupT
LPIRLHGNKEKNVPLFSQHSLTEMIKFLFYLFLIYIVYRLVFGRLLGGSFKTKVFHQNVHHHHNQTEQSEQEGKVTVNPKIKKDEKGQSGKIGEYVDYEEIN